jgi:hypothetical protein
MQSRKDTQQAEHIHPISLSRSLRLPVSQGPEGPKAQEALSALQAEVRCLREQPDAAAAFAAAAGATPDTADRLLDQLTHMLHTMEQRQRDAESAASQAPGAASGAAGPSTASANHDAGGRAPSEAGTPQQPRQQQQMNAEADASAIAMLRAEVARLQRLKEAGLQADQAFESMQGKVAMPEPAGASETARTNRVSWSTGPGREWNHLIGIAVFPPCVQPCKAHRCYFVGHTVTNFTRGLQVLTHRWRACQAF